MPHTTAGRNAMLDAIGVTHASLHSGFPGNTGANEISGGAPAYARLPVTFGASASGERAQTVGGTFNIPAGTTVQFVGFFNALTGGSFRSYHPAGNQPAREFICDLATDLVRVPAHGYANGQTVVFCGDTAPGGLTEGTVYFVVSAATDSFQVSLTNGGAAIDLTSQAGAACQVIRMIAEVYGAQGTGASSGSTLTLNL